MNLVNNEELKDRIKKLRKNKGLTQLELADMLHVTDKAVSKWETGEGNPEITILIEISKIFGVSIDYLLTGKEPEKELIIMSKMELCCKEDNAELFMELPDETVKSKDDQGKTILDYIEQYNSKKIFFALVSRFKPSNMTVNSRVYNFQNFNPDKIMELIFKYDDINSLESIDFFKHDLSRWCGKITNNARGSNDYKVYVDKYIELMINNVPEDSIIVYCALLIHKEETINNLLDWQSVYIKMLQYALLNDKKFEIERISQAIININEKAIEEINKKISEASYNDKKRYKFAFKPTNIISDYDGKIYNYAVVATPVSVLELLIEKGYVDFVKKLNDFNIQFKAETISNGIITAALMKKDGKSSEDDIFIASCIEYGILNIEKLLKSNNYETIKKGLNNYPITIYEYLMQLYEKGKFKELFEFSIDYNFNQIADMLLNIERYGYDKFRKYIMEINSKATINSSYNINKEFYDKKGYVYIIPTLDNVNEVKQKVLNNASLKFEKQKLTKDITLNYLNELLNNKEYEMLIIKLCVKLEAIFKCDYKLEGTFEEMMKQYISKHLYWTEDDGWGYSVSKSDDKTIKLINNLRIKRNSIVHSSVTEVSLSFEDLKYCIEYICKLDKEV